MSTDSVYMYSKLETRNFFTCPRLPYYTLRANLISGVNTDPLPPKTYHVVKVTQCPYKEVHLTRSHDQLLSHVTQIM